MTRTILFHGSTKIIFFCLTFQLPQAQAKPKKGNPIDPEAAKERLFQDQTKRVNQRNYEIKSKAGLPPNEDKEVNHGKVPLTMTPEQIKQDDAFKDPEDDIPDPEDPEDNGPKSMAERQKGAPPSSALDGQPKARSNAPVSVPSSSSGGVAVPGQADPNMIVFPGRKKK